MTPPASPRELTANAVLLGVLLAVVMGAANVYLGLKIGMTVSASIPAAVVAMGLFRLLPRGGTLHETNMVQTSASAGESLAAGIIFTMPALVIAGVWESFSGWDRFWVITLVALGGGFLGILFMIPMRKVFVVDDKDLPYPEGVACAEVLRAGEGSGGRVGWLVGGLLAGGGVKALQGWIGWVPNTLEWARSFGGRVLFLGSDVSLALVSVGYIVGLRIAVLMFFGGGLAWLIGIPLLGPGFEPGGGAEGGTALAHAWNVWSGEIRYVGVGAMVVGGLASIVKVRHSLVTAVVELSGQLRASSRGSSTVSTERNLGGGAIIVWALLCVLLLGALYFYFMGTVAIALLTLAIMVVLSFFFTAVASYIVGLVGNSNSPVSGMTITAVLVTAGLIYACGYGGQTAILATLGVAGVVCCVACTAGDVCNDLKTGHLIGATPRSQQIIQLVGVFAASFVMWPVLFILHEGDIQAGGSGIGGENLRAPQAQLFASLANGFFGDGDLPTTMVAIGVVVGLIVVGLDAVLVRVYGAERAFRLHPMPFAVGMYLPLGVSVPILLGGLVAHFTRARRGAAGGTGILTASGMIAGESLMGVGLATLAFVGIGTLKWESLGAGFFAVSGLLVLAFAALLLVRAANVREPKA